MIPCKLRKTLLVTLLCVLLSAPLSPAYARPFATPSQDINISGVVPGARLLVGWLGRNRTYKSAEEFIQERTEYYDALRATLRKQLLERDISKLRSSQLAAYIKEVNLIEGERASALAFAESIKKGARRDFNEAVKQELLNRIMATGMMTKVFTAINTGLGQAQSFVDGIIQELQTGRSIGDSITKLSCLTNQLTVATSLFGGSYSAGIRSNLENITGRLKEQANLTQQGLEEMRSDLSSFQQKVSALQQQGRLPASSQVGTDLALQLVGLGEGTPETEAILGLLGRRSGLSVEQVRERGTAMLQAGYVARCRVKAARISEEIKRLQNQDLGGEAGSLCDEVKTSSLLAQVQASPNAQASPEAGQDNRLRFQESDCPPEGSFSLEIQARAGVLSCDYSMDGPHGGTGKGYRIWELNNPASVQEQLSNCEAGAKESAAHYSNEENAHLEVIRDDESGYIYMQTYSQAASISGDEKPPLCGHGGGVLVVDEKYVFGVILSSCELGDDPNVYAQAVRAFVDQAKAALQAARERVNE